MLTPRAKWAIARRIFLIGGVVLGILFTFWQRSMLYRASVEDFAGRQQREYAWTGRRTMSLDEYIGFKTEGHLLHKEGPAWQDLHGELATRGGYCFFLPEQTPLSELAGHLNDSFAYVALEHGGKTVYLDVVESRPGNSPAAPSRLRYPLRRFALGVFLAGLLGYILVPWPKRNPNVVAYTRFIGALLPDFGLGVLFVGAFFTMPWLIVPNEAGTSHPLVADGGWIILTLVMWGFCLFGLAIHIVTAWYEVLHIEVGDDHLMIESLRGVERVAFADIERLTFGVRQPPKALIRAGLLISVLSARAAGPALLLASRDDRVLCLAKRDGQMRSFSLTGIYHTKRLIEALKQAQIPVDRELEALPN